MTEIATAVHSAVRPPSPLRRISRAGKSGHRSKVETALAALVYFGFACYMTWPLVTGLGHIIYGAAGDPFGTIAFYRELVDHHRNPFLAGTVSQFSAPEGQAIPWPRDWASLPGVLTMYTLTAAFGAVPAFGLYTLFGYTLTGVVTFLFARRLTGSSWAALIAGWAFAFYPFAILNGQGHLDFVHGWVLILAVWRIVELMWRPSRRNGLLAGMTVVLAMWWSPYFILFGAVIYAVGTTVAIAVAWRGDRLRDMLVPQLAAGIVVGAFLAFLAALSTAGTNEGIGARTQGVVELNTYSARPLEYLLPDVRSPLFGADTHRYLETHLHGSNFSESTLYVGVSVILLALIAVGAGLGQRLRPRLWSAVVLLAAVALAALVTSAPPQGRVLGILVPFPSHFISQISSTWRVYSRFVMVVMLALSLLAAVGLHALTSRRSLWLKVGVMSLATFVVPLDLWSRLAGRTNTLITPNVYKVLARQPMGGVAEYPLGPASYDNYGDMFFQNVYEKPMINGYIEGTVQERRARSLADLSDPRTAERLATLGVRYVIVDAVPPSYASWPPPGKPSRGFRLLFREPYADLYAVTAHAGAVLAAAGEGFGDLEAGQLGAFNWLEQPSGTVSLTGACDSCEGVLTMTVASFARPRTVEVSDHDGRLLLRRTVVGPTRLTVPLRFSRRASVEIQAKPGPQSIAKTTGGPDPRSVSVQVWNPTFISRSEMSSSIHARRRGRHSR